MRHQRSLRGQELGLGSYELARYHPVHHFWLFQTYETVIFIGLALALLGVAIYLIRRRIA